MKREGKRQGGKREAAMSPWMAQLKGVAVGGVAAVLLLVLCAVLIAAAVLPEKGMDACVLICCAVGTMIGGVSVANGGKRGMIWGVCIGAVLAVVFGVSGFFLYRCVDVTWWIAVSCACVCGGGLAGVLKGGKTKRRRG